MLFSEGKKGIGSTILTIPRIISGKEMLWALTCREERGRKHLWGRPSGGRPQTPREKPNPPCVFFLVQRRKERKLAK